jgi:hypothetical protein
VAGQLNDSFQILLSGAVRAGIRQMRPRFALHFRDKKFLAITGEISEAGSCLFSF